MLRYKRNQVEEAIAATLAASHEELVPKLRVRVKRLLEADRILEEEGTSARAKGPFAFFTGEAPGSGLEVWFSHYEAFAILVALRLLSHGWPQRTVVRVMRRLRPKLEREHRRILKMNGSELFNEDTVRQQARPGMFAVGTKNPVFLAIVSRRGEKADAPINAFGVCRGQEELMKFIQREAPLGMATTCFEIVTSAALLSQHLSQTQPKKRGRG